MTILKFRNFLDAIQDYEVILFDLWGVIIEDGKNYPGVIDVVNEVIKQKTTFFLSNAPRPNFVIAENLSKWGLNTVTAEKVLTSGDVARNMIEEANQKLSGRVAKIYHLGDDRNDDILINMHYELVDDIDDADILLLSLHRDSDEDINQFNDILKKAAENPNITTICSNPDITVPKGDSFRYCAGHFASIVENFGGEVVYTGKPKKIIYDRILKMNHNIPHDKILMVGDTFETDVLGANQAGIHSALVMTGNAKNFHKMHDSMDDKMAALSEHAKRQGVTPTFVTKVVS